MTQVEFREYARIGNVEMVEKGLKQKSIKPEKRNRQGESAMDMVIRAPGLSSTHTKDQLKVIELLLKAGVEPTHVNYDTLVLYGHLDALKTMYKHNDMRIQKSELQSGIVNGHIETVRFVLENNDGMIDNYDLLLLLTNGNNWGMNLEMFKTIFEYVTDASYRDNKYILEIVKNIQDPDIIDLITSDEKVTAVAVELGQEELYPKEIRNVFLF